MIDIEEFCEINYGYRPAKMWTVNDFNIWKDNNGHDTDWDYPLSEYDVIAENHKEFGTEYKAVRFSDNFGGYDYRFCEVHKE